MVSAQDNADADDLRDPLVEDPGDMVLLLDEEPVPSTDAFAAYVRTRPYEAILLTAAAGMTLGLLVGLRS